MWYLIRTIQTLFNVVEVELFINCSLLTFQTMFIERVLYRKLVSL